MKVTTKILAAVSALVLGLVVAGCSSGSSSSGGSGGSGGGFGANVQLIPARQQVVDAMKGKKIAFVPLLYNGYLLTENMGTTMQRTFDNVGANFKVYDANFDSDRMVNTVNNLIATHGADVLVLQVQSLGLLDNAIAQAEQKGIYTIVVNEMSTRLGDSFVGVDVYGAAQSIAKRAAADCTAQNKPKNVTVIDGPGNDSASILWDQGIKDTLGPLGYQVSVAHSQYQDNLAVQDTNAAIQQSQGNMCAIMPVFDANAVTVGKTVKASGHNIGVYTLDANAGTCAALQDGTVTATAAYDVQGIGEAAAVQAQNLIVNKVKAGSTHSVAFVSHAVVDKSSAPNTTIACYKQN